MNSLYKIISKQRWIIPFYILVLIFAIFYATKLIFDFRDDRMITFLIQPIFFLIVFMIAVYFFKDNNKLLLLFTSFTMWFLVEFSLYKVSPYKSYVEANGGYYYISLTSKNNEFEHSRLPNSRKKYKQTEFTVDFVTNNYGYRGESPNVKNLKIILAGDSFIEGWGVDNDSTINKVVEQRLNCENCVMNAGLTGGDFISFYNKMDDLIKSLKPNILILNINPSDFTDIYYRYLYIENDISSIFEFFYGSSFIFRHLSHLFLDIDTDLITKTNKIKFKKELNELIFEYLKIYKTKLDNLEVDFFITLQPYSDNLKMPLNKSPMFFIHKFLEENNFKFYHAHEDLQKYGDFESLHWPLDRHFNNAGARVYGNLIYEALIKEYNIDSIFNN